MRSRDYWKKRAIQRVNDYNSLAYKSIAKVTISYKRAMKDIQADIAKIFGNFMAFNDLSIEEATEFLRETIPSNILDAMKLRLMTMQEGREKQLLLAEINGQAYKARITRLQALHESLRTNYAVAADFEKQAVNGLVSKVSEEAYTRTLFDLQKGVNIGVSFAEFDERLLRQILNSAWTGSNYSDRIWSSNMMFATKLETILTEGMLAGKSNDWMAKKLAEMEGSSEASAARLIRTETTFIANAAEMQAYRETGVERYAFLGTLDSRTCDICGELDGQIFDVADGKTGVNIPPMHPNCRCTTIPADDAETFANLRRRARDLGTGRTEILPRNITYEEWRQKYENQSN